VGAGRSSSHTLPLAILPDAARGNSMQPVPCWVEKFSTRCVIVPKETLLRGQSGKEDTVCSGGSWFWTMVQVSSAFFPTSETALGCRLATYTWKGRCPSAHAFLPHGGAHCISDSQLLTLFRQRNRHLWGRLLSALREGQRARSKCQKDDWARKLPVRSWWKQELGNRASV